MQDKKINVLYIPIYTFNFQREANNIKINFLYYLYVYSNFHMVKIYYFLHLKIKN